MSDARWNRIKELASAALDMQPEARERFLRDACGDDEELRREVETLIRDAEGISDSFLEPPSLSADSPAGDALPPHESPPMQLGEFELLDEVGRGGVGVVYRARQAGLDRIVAVKVLEAGLTTSQQAIERFQREARAVAKLNHEAIVPIHAVGREGNTYWFAMEYVAGGDLAQELKRQRLESEPRLPVPGATGHARPVAERIRNVARALEAAHAAGVVHRDVKPQNLLLDDDGDLRLVDFGLAKDESEGSISLTGELLGTPYYMSPEQARSRRDSIDHRTDVYSLGTVLYEMLTLRRPFDGDTLQEVLSDILGRDPATVRRYNSAVPRDLELICAKAMAKQIDERYASAGEFADDLDRFLNLEAVVAQAPSFWARARRLIFRRRATFIAAAVAAVALAGGYYLAVSAIARRTDRQLTDEVAGLLSIEDWSPREVEVVALRERLQRRAVDAPPSAALKRSAEEFQSRLEQHASTLAERGAELRRRGLGRVLGPGGASMPIVPRDLFLSLQYLKRAQLLTPGVESIESIVEPESAYPTLSVQLDAETVAAAGTDEFEASLVLIDPLGVDPPTVVPLLGEPGEPMPVAPGRFRVRVEVEGYGLAELNRNFEWGGELALNVRVRPFDEARRGMIRIPGGEMTIRRGPDSDGHGGGPGCFVNVDSVDVEPFWIDEAEVSNDEYLEFVLATGQEPPVVWLDGGFESSFADLDLGVVEERFGSMPVVSLTWSAAVEFAEWRGKRLPTHEELELALRGSSGFFGPWPGSVTGEESPGSPGLRVNIDGPVIAADFSSGSLLAQYVANALPVRAEAYRQPPFGLYHGFGNVSELTESALSYIANGVVEIEQHCFVTLGGSWQSKRLQQNLASHGTILGASNRWMNIASGFRCASSDA